MKSELNIFESENDFVSFVRILEKLLRMFGDCNSHDSIEENTDDSRALIHSIDEIIELVQFG